jgi:hypothetical protein
MSILRMMSVRPPRVLAKGKRWVDLVCEFILIFVVKYAWDCMIFNLYVFSPLYVSLHIYHPRVAQLLTTDCDLFCNYLQCLLVMHIHISVAEHALHCGTR